MSSRELSDSKGLWEIIQIDFLAISGIGYGELLIVVDTYSRFLFVVQKYRTNAKATFSLYKKSSGCGDFLSKYKAVMVHRSKDTYLVCDY